MWNDRWLAGLERVVLVLFVLTAAGALVSLVDPGRGWWSTAWEIVRVAFVLVLLLYLSVGGAERMSGSRAGVVSLVLLALSVLANLADTFFDMDSTAWQTARGVVAVGFFVAFAAYLVARFRHRTPVGRRGPG